MRLTESLGSETVYANGVIHLFAIDLRTTSERFARDSLLGRLPGTRNDPTAARDQTEMCLKI